MATSPSIYDIANLRQITQAGGPLIDYLDNKRKVEEAQRSEGVRLSNAMTLQNADNQFTGQQRALDRRNTVTVVEAQERSRINAARTLATSRLEARYPRKDGESDDDYMARVGKLQAMGPNKAYKQALSVRSGARKEAQNLENEIQQAMTAEEQRRRPKIEARAREDSELLSAFTAAGAKTVPASVPKAIELARVQKGGAAKAEALEAAWQAALAKADSPDLVPYSVELGSKVKRLQNQIKTVNDDAQDRSVLLYGQAKILIDDPTFSGGSYLDFEAADVGATPPPPPGDGVKLTPDAAGRTAALQAYVPGPTGEMFGPPSRAGLAPSREAAPVPPMLKGPAVAPSPSVNAFGIPTFSGIGRAIAGAVQSIPMNPYGGIASPSLPVAPSFNRFMGALGAGAGGGGVDPLVQLFGPDAPELLAPGGPAGKLATSRGMPEEEQRARFERALAGDPKEIAGIKRVLDFLRSERQNPTEPFYSVGQDAPYTDTTPTTDDLLLPR